jgi:hypothetical protein
MTQSKLQNAVPVLPVRDVARAVAFYCEKLGFQKYFELGPYAGIGRGSIELHLDGSSPFVAPIRARLGVAGVDGLHDELAKHDVIDPAEPLETKPFGMRQFTAIDPDQNRITFFEPVAAIAERANPKKRFLITFTHVASARGRMKKEDVPAMIESHTRWTNETDAQPRSSLVYLAPANEAKNVRRHADGRIEVSDGTYKPGDEEPGGFTILEAESMEAAVELAKRSRWLEGSNEVREIKTPPGLRAWIRSEI